MTLCTTCRKANVSCPIYPQDTMSCVEYAATDSDRIAALEAEVERLNKQVGSLLQSLTASKAFGPIDPIPKIGPGSKWEPPEVRPVELDPQLVKELREAVAKFCKDRKEVDGE